MNYFPVEEYRPASFECIIESSIRRNVPANVMLAIAQIEAGKEGLELKNKNGSFDFGRMGINSKHLEELKRYGVDVEVAKKALKFDGCYNIEMSAYLVQKHLSANNGKDFWTKAANYHSKTPSKNAVYKAKLIPRAEKWANYLTYYYSVKDYQK